MKGRTGGYDLPSVSGIQTPQGSTFSHDMCIQAVAYVYSFHQQVNNLELDLKDALA